MAQIRHKGPERIKLRGGGSLVQRNARWHVDFCVGREPRQRISLGTADKKLAKEKAEVLIESAHRGELGKAMEAMGISGSRVSIPELCDLYRAHARIEGVSDRTIVQNITSLRRILALGTGRPAEECGADDLTVKVANAARAALLDSCPGSNRASRDRSIASMFRQARSMLSPGCLAAYPELPEGAKGFAEVRHKAEAKRYERPPEMLIERTHQAASRLREENPGLHVVYLLAYRLGLRPGEIASARWDWLEASTGGGQCLRVNFKRRVRRIPVAPALLEELRALGGEVYIVPAAEPRRSSETPEGIRKNLVERTFSEWMRGLGWADAKYPKAAYELRKLAGSRWYTELGAERAAALLGHGNVAITCQYYAVLDRPIAPEDVDRVFHSEGVRHAG